MPDGKYPPVHYTKANGHFIFVRMTLERNTRWVKDGHKTPESKWSTFAGVVSRESIISALTYAALNGHYILCGPKSGLENEGRIAILVRALYGGKSVGTYYCSRV